MRGALRWMAVLMLVACTEPPANHGTQAASSGGSSSNTSVTVEAPSAGGDASVSGTGSAATGTSTTPTDGGASGATAANPCGPPRRLRLPDGGIDYEACVGACSLVHPDAAHGGAATPRGSISLEQVDRALRRDARLLYGCFERVARDHPELVNAGGVVRVRFVVGADGRVRGNPNSTGMEDNPEIGQCLTRRVSYIVFPPPQGGSAEVQVPFNFGNSA